MSITFELKTHNLFSSLNLVHYFSNIPFTHRGFQESLIDLLSFPYGFIPEFNQDPYIDLCCLLISYVSLCLRLAFAKKIHF